MAESTLYTIVLDKTDREKLDELAERTQRTRAALIRWLIQEAHENVVKQPAPLPYEILTAQD